MIKTRINKSGIALFIVLATILVILLLGEITLKFMASQNRFTHESVNRIQAYYAVKAGMNYALEMLRLGTWSFPANCAAPAGCVIPTLPNEFPPSIVLPIKVIFCPPGNLCAGSPFQCLPPPGINFCINTTVTYHNQ